MRRGTTLNIVSPLRKRSRSWSRAKNYPSQTLTPLSLTPLSKTIICHPMGLPSIWFRIVQKLVSFSTPKISRLPWFQYILRCVRQLCLVMIMLFVRYVLWILGGVYKFRMTYKGCWTEKSLLLQGKIKVKVFVLSLLYSRPGNGCNNTQQCKASWHSSGDLFART